MHPRLQCVFPFRYLTLHSILRFPRLLQPSLPPMQPQYCNPQTVVKMVLALRLSVPLLLDILQLLELRSPSGESDENDDGDDNYHPQQNSFRSLCRIPFRKVPLGLSRYIVYHPNLDNPTSHPMTRLNPRALYHHRYCCTLNHHSQQFLPDLHRYSLPSRPSDNT